MSKHLPERCKTCRHKAKEATEYPCNECVYGVGGDLTEDRWEPIEEYKCETCKYDDLEHYEYPCRNCLLFDKWEPKETATANSQGDHIRPAHYQTGGIEPIDYMKAKMSLEMFEGFLVGNVIKYVSRYRQKDGLKDLEKAQYYLNRLIEEIKAHKPS